MPLTADQARALADAFRGVANTLSDYTHAQWASLSPLQRQKLDSAEWDLRTNAYNFRTIATGLDLDHLQNGLATLQDATQQAQAAVARIGTAAVLIRFITHVVMLGGAITSLNPAAIVDSATSLLAAVRKLP